MTAAILNSPSVASSVAPSSRARLAGRILGGIGYLGGAIATNLRVDAPLVSHTLFPIYVAAIIWGGLYLRGDSRIRALIHSAG